MGCHLLLQIFLTQGSNSHLLPFLYWQVGFFTTKATWEALMCPSVKFIQLCLTLCDPTDYTVHGILQARYCCGWPFPSPGDLPNPGIKPRCPALQANSLSAEPQGKPKNIGVGSLSLLQQIFPTQESNRGLLHCRRILYQLGYLGSTKQGPIPGHLSAPPWMPVELLHHFSPNGYLYNLMTDPKGNMPRQTLFHKTMSQIKWLF